MKYIHLNPLAENWQLATDSSYYFYSSAAFYKKDISNFEFMKNLQDEF
jgi:hypothetical protein